LTVRSGNTEQADLGLFARLTRETSLTRFNNQYAGSLASDSTGTTANSHRMTNTFDVYLTRRFFITLMSFELFADEFLNIDIRLTPAVLLGYDVMANKWVTWEIGAGVGYQYTRGIQSTTGSLARSDVAILVTTGIDVDITSDIEWDTDYKLNITPTNTDLTSQNITSVLEFDIIGPIDIEATFIFDRIRLPLETSPGVRPKSNDYRLTLGFGADF
jgi:hypothetical protein